MCAIAKAVISGASYTEQEIELGAPGKGKLHLTCTVSPIDDARCGAAHRVPPHRPAAQDRARGAPARAAAGQPRPDPQPRARDQESARAASAARRSSSKRELDRPQLSEYTQVIIGEADRLQSLVNRLLTPTACRHSGAPTSTRSSCACAASCRRSFRRSHSRSDFDISIPEFEADPGAAHAGRAQHRAQRGAGAGRRARPIPRSRLDHAQSRAASRWPSAAIAWRSRWRSRDNGPGIPAGHPRQDLLSAGVRPRRRQRPRPHDRADVRRPAQRHDRMGRASPGADGVHDPAPAGMMCRADRHARMSARGGQGS